MIELNRVRFAYPGRDAPALDGIDWDVERGELALVVGPSGSGKSTLLRTLNGLVPHFTGGRLGGQVLINGLDTRLYGPRALSRTVGFVFQDPDAQHVAPTVADEVAFGMEQLGVPPRLMRRRVEETLELLGIRGLRDRTIDTLSGGERQRVAVAAAMAPQPSILVLDEPTSQLDPRSAGELLDALHLLNGELGKTVVVAEHRLERLLAMADEVVLMDVAGGANAMTPEGAAAELPAWMLPQTVRLFRELGLAPAPLSSKDARRMLATFPYAPVPDEPTSQPGALALTIEGATLGYRDRAVLRDVTLGFGVGEIVAVIGANGTGKTTLLRSLLGTLPPLSGRIELAGDRRADKRKGGPRPGVAYLPQRADAVLFAQTVRAEIDLTLAHRPGGADPGRLVELLELGPLLDRDPHDLSVGERERVALAAVLAGMPPLLLLDEPTRGMDGQRKARLASLLTAVAGEGTTVVVATHDMELAADIADRVVLLGDGGVLDEGTPREVMGISMTFTTPIGRTLGGRTLTVSDALAAYGDGAEAHARLAAVETPYASTQGTAA